MDVKSRSRRVVVALTMLAGALSLLGTAVPAAAGVCWILALALFVSAGVVAGFNYAEQRVRR